MSISSKQPLVRLFFSLILLATSAGCGNNEQKSNAVHIITDNEEFTTSEALDLNTKGIASGSSGDYNQAREYFNEALKIEPNNVTVLCNLANVEMLAGNEEEAVNIYNKCIAADSSYYNAYLNCSRILYNRGESATVQEYCRAVLRGSKDPRQTGVAHYMLAKMYHSKSECDSAKKHVQLGLEDLQKAQADLGQIKELQTQIQDCQ
jgi:tetratricopeptide (TPR) repeat protein